MAHEDPDVTRRLVLRTAAVTGVAMPLLVACGSDNQGGGGTAGGEGETGAGGEAGTALATTADVPVGEGIVLADQKVVVTQPSEGEFMAFTAVCTHKGCTVKDVADGTINCPCHGSRFNMEDGTVANGPATAPLEEIPISVEGDQIVRA